jgi:hypothetical protein
MHARLDAMMMEFVWFCFGLVGWNGWLGNGRQKQKLLDKPND